MAGRGMEDSRQGWARLGEAWLGKARHGKARHGRFKAWHGMAWLGEAGLGLARRGPAWQGRFKARLGWAGLGEAWLGRARQGRARQGKAGQGLSINCGGSDEVSEYARYIGSVAWYKLRELRRAHDKNRCRTCGSSEQLECHHVTYERFGNEELDDLIMLCKECHEAITNVIRMRRYSKRDVNSTISEVKDVALPQSNGQEKPTASNSKVQKVVLPENKPRRKYNVEG